MDGIYHVLYPLYKQAQSASALLPREAIRTKFVRFLQHNSVQDRSLLGAKSFYSDKLHQCL